MNEFLKDLPTLSFEEKRKTKNPQAIKRAVPVLSVKIK